MNDDVLRDRLIALDPDAGAPTDPVTSDRARALLETIMSTPTSTPNHPDRTTDRPDTGGHESTVVAMRRTVGRRWMVTFAGAAAAAVAAITFVAVRGGDEPVTTSTFSLASSDPLTQMCLPFDPTLLAAVPVAFAGTVTDITTDDTGTNVVRIETDRWYRGDATDVVELTVPSGFTAALDGVDFVTGQRYLVSVADGVVTSCGMSGVATPDYEAQWDVAFGS